jgi:SAM-dependent methyltransferase
MINHSSICIDIRPASEFLEGHRLASAHFEGVEALTERQFELPEPQQSMLVIHNPNQLIDLTHWLESKHYRQVQQQAWSTSFKFQLMQQNLFAMGASKAYVWQPSPLVRRFVGEIGLTNELIVGRGLDVGCGSGRDLVYLAMQGWQMIGVDLRTDMLEKAQRLAQRQAVSVQTWLRDCETLTDPFQDCPDGSFQLIHVARYLHRPLFSVFKRLLAPKGYIVYHTFMQGCEAFGSPKNPRFLLAKNELSAIFSDYEVLCDEVIFLNDGRPMSAFIAQKL